MLYSFAIEHLVLPSIALLSKSRVAPLLQQLRRSERWPIREMHKLRQHQLGRMLEHASRIPFYRSRLAAAGIRPTRANAANRLIDLPPTTRSDIEQAFPDEITEKSLLEESRLVATSGTTSDRLPVLQDFRKRDAVRAAQLHSISFCGSPLGTRILELPPDICSLQCGRDNDPEPPIGSFLRTNWIRCFRNGEARSDLRGLIERQVILRQTVIPGFAANGLPVSDDDCFRLLKQISQLRPSILKGLAAYLLTLARFVLKSGIRRITFKEIRPMGSLLSPEMKRIVRKAFDCHIFEDYGSAELGAIACECHHQQGMHVFEQLFFVEVVKEHGQPCHEGETGRILITDLTNRVMPLIRYEIGDIGYFLSSPCPCGRTTKRIVVLGRLANCLSTPQSTLIAEQVVQDAVFSLGCVDWFQVKQTAEDRFDVQFTAQPGSPVGASRLQQALEDLLGPQTIIRIRQVRRIKPEASGKYRFVVRSLRHAQPHNTKLHGSTSC